MTYKRILPIICMAVSLTACQSFNMTLTQPSDMYDSGDEAFYERPLSARGSDSAHAEEVRRDTFNVKFKKVADKRRPQALANSPEQDVVYEYDPDKLQGGVRSLVQNHLDDYFGVNSRGEEELIAELDIRDFRTQIVTGTLLSGRNGRYRVKIEADVRVRDGLGNVYVIETYNITRHNDRRTGIGYQPSRELDRKRILATVEDAMRDLGNELSRDVRLKLRNARVVR